MVNKRKKWGVLLVACVMMLSLLSACGGNNGNNSGSTPPANSGTGENGGNQGEGDGESAKPVKFSYVRPVWGPATYTKGGAYEKELFQRANAEIDVQIIPVTEYDQKIMTIISSGSMPDVLWANGPTDSKFKDMQEQGAFLRINEYLDKYPAVKEAVPQSLWDMLTDENGNIYFIPNVGNPITPIFLYYRQDWFEQLNLPEPTTLAELEAALETIKQSNLGVIPLTGQDTFWGLGALSTSFGFGHFAWNPASDDPNKEDPQKIVPWYMNEEAIDYHFWLKDLIKKGLLDKEFLIAKNWDHAKQKFTTGQAAVLGINWGYGPEIYNTLAQTDPNAKIGIMSPLAGENGIMGGVRPLGAFDRGMYISAKYGDPDGFFRFLEWTLTEGSDFRKYGIEGKMYTMVDGKKKALTEDEKENDYKTGQLEPLRFIAPMSEALNWDDVAQGYDDPDAFELARAKFEEYNQVQYPDYRNPTIFSETEIESGAQLYNDYLQQVVDGAVINDNITKQDWLDALDAYLKAGGQKIIDEVNAGQQNKKKPQY